MNKNICCLDLGSSKISGCILCFKNKNIKDIFFETYPTRALNRAKIKDVSKLTDALSELFSSLKKKSHLKISDVYLNISCSDLNIRNNFIVMPLLERGCRLINHSDIQKVKEQALALNSNWEEEIIQSIPISYTVDGKDGFLSPLGLYAHTLGINLLTISIKSSYFGNLNYIFDKLGYNLKDIHISGLGLLKYILEREALEKGLYVLLDIGAQVTDIVAYEDKRIKHIGSLDFGGDDLTEKISDTFKISFELAEDLKIKYGSVSEGTSDKREIMIKEQNSYQNIPYQKLCKVINDKIEDFLVLLKEYFEKNITDKKIEKIFVCGKSALLDGLLEEMELDLSTKVRMVSYTDFSFLEGIFLNKLFSPSQLLDYTNCLKIVYEIENLKKEPFQSNLPKGLFRRVLYWLKYLYQEYF